MSPARRPLLQARAGPSRWGAQLGALLVLLPLLGAGFAGAGLACRPLASTPANAQAAGAHPGSTLTVVLTESATSGTAPITITFTALASGGVPPYSFAWNFGDGTSGTGSGIQHTFQSSGNFSVTVVAEDSEGNYGFSSVYINVQSPGSTPPALDYLFFGALVAAALGIGVGVYASRKGGTSPEDDSSPPDFDLPSATYTPPGAFPTPPYQVIPRWVTNPLPPNAPGAPMPYQAPAAATRAPAKEEGESWGAPPRRPAVPAPSPGVGAPARTPVRGGPYAPPYAPVASTAYSPRGPEVPRPVSPPPAPLAPLAPTRIGPPPVLRPTVISAPAVATPTPTGAPPTYAATTARPSPILQPLLGLSPDDGKSPLESAAALNALPWRQIEEEAARAPTPQLARFLYHLDPLARLARRTEQDPNRVRLLLRDFFQAWLQRTRSATAAAVPTPAGRRFSSLLSTSSGTDVPSLRVRVGNAESTLTWRAVLRSAPILVLVLVAFVAVEAATFFALFAAYSSAGTTPTPVESLVVPFAVLGPPALILLAFPIVEWGVHLWRRSRARDTSDRLFALPQVRVLSYLLVLGLAETSRVAADLASSALFHTPSSILVGGGVSLWGIAGFLAVISATLFLAWSAISAWNVGGSQRATLCASLLYLMVLGIWVGTEARLLLYLSQAPTVIGVAGARGLLLDVPVYLLIACAFVITVFLAFTEPQLQREHQAAHKERLAVAQALMDDLESHPQGGAGIPLERVSDLARGSEAPKVAKALRELLTYDADSDRYLVLRTLDPALETVLYLHTRSDPAGAYYVLETATQAVAPAGGPSTGGGLFAGAGGGPSAGGAGDDLWSQKGLETPEAWLPVLRARKAEGGRLSRPSTDARSGEAYRALSMLLMDPGSDEARDLFRRVGWTKPSGTMLLARLIQAGKSGEAMCPDIETDGEYLEVELNRFSGHGEDATPFLGPWTIGAWKVVREVQTGSAGGIEYHATLSTSGSPSSASLPVPPGPAPGSASPD